MKIISYIFFITGMAAGTAAAQDIFVKTEYPRVVSQGEQFAITWTINTGGGEMTAPPFTGFYRLMGPQTSYSSSTSIINGKISQETSYSYTYYLQAVEPGRFTIPPAVIKVKGKEYSSDSLYIEVVADPSARQPGQGAGKQEVQEPAGSQTSGGDLYVRLIPSRTDIYAGEPVILTLKIYNRTDLSGIQEIKYPDFNGFIKEDIETPPLNSLQRENVNGVIYGTGVIQQFLIFPQLTGDLKIDPVQVTALVQQRISDPDPFFGDFFARFSNVQRVLVSNPVNLKVKPLPPGKPDNFTGLTGNVKISATLSRDTLKVNDALNLKITLSGSGNLKYAGAPTLKLSPDIEKYDPKISDNIRTSSAGQSGQRIYEYVLIPRHHGDFVIPSVTYSYFNPVSKQYETASTGELKFHVMKGSDQAPVAMFGGVSKEDVRYLGKDIRFIMSTPGLWVKTEKFLVNSPVFLYMYLTVVLIFIVLILIRREHIRRNSDIARVRNRKAGRIAGKRLLIAGKFMRSGDNDKFYEELLKALWGYLSDKLSIPLAEMNRTRAIEKLREKGVEESVIELAREIIDKCEFARFAPAAAPSENRIVYEKAATLIKTIENTL